MKKNDHRQSLGRNIKDKISRGEIKMRSRSYFIFKNFLLACGLFLLLILILYLSSLIIFVLRVNNILLLPGLGIYGIRAVLIYFHWLILLLAGIMVLVLELVAKRFALVFRRPLIYSLMVILVIVIGVSVFIDHLSLHRSLFRLAKEGELPAFGRMYRHLGDLEIGNIYFGSIISKEGDRWILKTKAQEQLILDVGDLSPGHRLRDRIEIGSQVGVVGEEVQDGVIEVIRFRRVGNWPGSLK